MMSDIETATDEELDEMAESMRDFRFCDHMAMTVHHVKWHAIAHKLQGDRRGQALYRLVEVKENDERDLIIEEHVLTKREAEFLAFLLETSDPARAIGIESRQQRRFDYRRTHHYGTGKWSTRHVMSIEKR
jgi:hypothetical protein